MEDDCVPHPDFFSFCTCLLERYRFDTRVWSICGSNFQLGRRRGNASYYFSIHGDSWGWASWRRAWRFYADADNKWPLFRDSGALDNIFPIPLERHYWKSTLDLLFIEGIPDAWDYQWWFASWMNNGLHAWPNSCLVSNCGIDDDSTHTFGMTDFLCPQLSPLGNLHHPDFVLPCREADEFAFLYRRDGIRLLEHSKFGPLYPWIRRYRQLLKEGPISYIYSRISRLLSPN